MKSIQYGLFLLFLVTSPLVFADDQQAPTSLTKNLIIQKDKIFDGDKLSLDSAQVYDKNFKFDWNNYATIEPNKKKIEEVANFIKNSNHEEFSKLKDLDKQALGRIFYRVGTYYTHVTEQPDLAIEAMNLADPLLQSKEDKAWNYNHLAYAYEQKFFTSKKPNDKKEAFFYINKIIATLYPHTNNKEVAFAYCIQGLMNNDEKNFGLAETSMNTALRIYEKTLKLKDDQYARAKNRLACILLGMNDRDDKAISMLEDLKQYWAEKKDYEQNPFAARNLISLAEAYLKVGKAKEASVELEAAIAIYQRVYGNQSELLVKPYQLLSHAYKNQGDQKLADSYEKKANELERG